MIEELDMHLLDLAQNAFSADASRIDVSVICDPEADRLTLRVSDDGKGMNEKTLNAVQRGYYSSKPGEAVGLGIPLLRETARHCDGSFDVESSVGIGTTVTAVFRRSHVDLPPFGDLAATFLNLIVTAGSHWVTITYRCDKQELELDTAMLSDLLGDLPLQHPEVIRFLKAYIGERLK